ncbi:hypothetical protein RYA05_02615 [Pseudomonas syringae pv. actinidiae]|nr:hypothetical protein [Pseudomonas syringae pv. actinidiae]
MFKEIVYYHEQHTLMYQEVTLKANEAALVEMLAECISKDSKRELIQTYYLCKLKQSIDIVPKNHYGAWNASIEEIGHIYSYEAEIVQKLAGHIVADDLEEQILVINRLAGLSEDEIAESLSVQADMFVAFGIPRA